MKKLEQIQHKIDKLMESIAIMQELHNTLIDQVTELNLLLANEGKSIYEQLLLKFDFDTANAIADDINNGYKEESNG